MRVLVLGGPGLIGVAVIRDLIKHCHKVLALSRSTRSVAILKALGASPLRRDYARQRRGFNPSGASMPSSKSPQPLPKTWGRLKARPWRR